MTEQLVADRPSDGDQFAATAAVFALNADERGETGPNGKESLTSSEAAAQIGRSNLSWGGVLGQGATVTFGFRSSAPANMPDDTEGFSRFNAAQISAVRGAFDAWSDVANIRFQPVTDAQGYSNAATLLFGNYQSGADGAAAFAYLPGSTSASSSAGDVWVNASLGYNVAPSLLGYGYQVLTHEIGHAIGLQHPSVYNAGEGVTITYTANASYYEDTRQYTIMSYFNELNTGGNFNSSAGGRQYSAAPLLDDIAAAQRLYGANTTTRAGDTVYGFGSTAERPWFAATSASTDLIFALWDAGGTDTLNFAGYADNQIIDLRQGAFSDVGGLVGNIAIALGTVIENANGGSGSDLIRGNSADNRLSGGAGSDTIDGGAGTDTAVFSGVFAAYSISYTGQTALVSGPDGSDRLTNVEFLQFADQRVATTLSGGVTLTGDAGADVLTGTAFADSLTGYGGADTLTGLGGADLLDGGAGNDTLSGGDGDDQLSGGAGDDRIDGGAGYDIADYGSATASVTLDLSAGVAAGGAGSDVLIGIEEVRGSAFADRLIGSAGSDVLRGGGGVDTLEGGAGDDRLFAGPPGRVGGAPDITKGAAVANNSFATAISLDAGFDTVARAGVANDTSIPHASVLATTHGGVEYYAFTVQAGARATFDIDGSSFDSTLRLFNAQGVELSSNDDGGSDGFNATDSLLTHTFATAGVYYLQVAEWISNQNSTFSSGAPGANGSYALHVSITGHAEVAPTLVGALLDGGAGADTLAGGAGDDVMDGGEGDDLLTLIGSASDYQITRTSTGWRIDGPEGSDFVSNVERVQFGAAAPVPLEGGAGQRPFDPLVYIASSPDLIIAFGADAAAGAAHYAQYQALYPRPTDSFDPLVYIASYPDLIAAFGADARAGTIHYIQHGFFEGRATATFDPLIYAASSVDLALAFGTDTDAAARHFITYSAQHTHPVTGFQPLEYLASNPDLARLFGYDAIAGVNHYLDVGVREGRPTDGFDPLVYVASHADLIRAIGANADAAIQHYLTYGADEGRATDRFDPREYAATHTDLARIVGSSGEQAALHYIQYGFAEGRAVSGFDEVGYLLTYGDLAGLSASQALDHWLTFGADEGRIGDAIFARDQTDHSLASGLRGVVDFAGERDWYQVTMGAGQRIGIDLNGAGAGGGTLADGLIRIYSADGRLLVREDAGGPGADARLTFAAPTSGVYYVVVSGTAGSTGSYQIATAARAPDAEGMAVEEAGRQALWLSADEAPADAYHMAAFTNASEPLLGDLWHGAHEPASWIVGG